MDMPLLGCWLGIPIIVSMGKRGNRCERCDCVDCSTVFVCGESGDGLGGLSME